jgi:uncharacterized membrane protein YfbV (UPF0208 family)
MDSFITRLKAEAEHFFSSEKTLSSADKKTLEEVTKTHELLINKITTDIISFFMENKNKDEYILELLEPSVCNDITLYLTESLDAQYTQHPITKFQDNISVSKAKHKVCTTRESCTKQLKDTLIRSDPPTTKWDLCYAVASHYVKMLNLLGALLIGISPEKNMCMERINSLYKIVDQPDGSQGFEINICRTTGKKAVKDRISDENGMRELINLYILDHMDKTATDSDLKAMDIEYKKLIKALNGSLTKRFTDHITPIVSHVVSSIPKKNTKTNTKKNTSMPKIILPISQNIPSTSVLAKRNITPVNSNVSTSLVDKIKSFEEQVKLVESKSKTKSLPDNIKKDIQQLKNTSSKFANLMTVRNITPDSVKKVVSSYPIRSSSYSISDSEYNSSSYESETNSTNSTNTQDDIVIYINDAYDKLSKIRDSAISDSTSSYNSTESSAESNSDAYTETETSDSESEQNGGGLDMMKDDSMTKFFNFIKKYKEYWSPEVRKYFDELISNSFIQGPVTDVCNAAKVGNKDIFIDTMDIYEVQTLQDFLDNFNDMRTDYIDYCDKITDILENDLLETIKDKRTINYKFRNLSTNDLAELQIKCRKILLEMYTGNHTYYLKGVVILKRYFTSSFYKKAQNNKK